MVITPMARHPLLWKVWNDITVPNAIRKIGVNYIGLLMVFLHVPQYVQWITIHDLNFEHHPEWITAAAAKYYQKQKNLEKRSSSC